MTVAPVNPDNNSLLVQLCVKVLKNAAPEGMTTKELAAELDKEVVPGFDGISSSILSSKLNAVFRRSHNESQDPSREQLADLPLTRGQSSEIPRRLVYRYSPPSSETNKKDIVALPVEASRKRRASSRLDRIKSPPPEIHSPTLEEDASSTESLTEPLTPKEDHVSEGGSWPSAKRRRASTKDGAEPPLPAAQTESGAEERHAHMMSASRRSAADPSHRPHTPPNTSNSLRKLPVISRGAHAPKFNLYYDAVGVDTVSAALAPIATFYEQPAKAESRDNCVETKPSSESDFESLMDVASPESLGLSELDNFVC